MMAPEFITLTLLLLGAIVGCFFALRSGHRVKLQLGKVEREQESIVAEERRLFSFLHTLGAAIAKDHRGIELSRLIVHGAMQVTGARGGVLYSFDEQRQQLVPRFCSNDCAPLIDLTTTMVAQPELLLSAMRLHAPAINAGLLGSVFANGKAEWVPNLGTDARITSAANVCQTGHSAMVGVLVSGARKLGVLAVTCDMATKRFTDNDFEVFASLVEQAAFALAHSQARQEAQTKQQIEAELQNASEVQRILLPENDPPIDGWVIAGRNRAAHILSGDFYDYLAPDAQHFGMVIADVSGKGLPAALVAATTRSALQAHAQTLLSPARVLNAVNRQLAPDIRQDMFVSMIYAVIEVGGSKVKLARAGHPNPYLWRQQSGTVETVRSPGIGIGIDDGDVFERVMRDHEITLSSGDLLLCYTDGINEAMDADGDEFGGERIEQVLAKSASKGAQAVVDDLIAAVNAFVGSRSSTDDITVIALQKS